MRSVSRALLCVAAARALTPALDVDWDAFLGRADLLWEWSDAADAPLDYSESAFVGNGALGAML